MRDCQIMPLFHRKTCSTKGVGHSGYARHRVSHPTPLHNGEERGVTSRALPGIGSSISSNIEPNTPIKSKSLALDLKGNEKEAPKRYQYCFIS